MLEQRQQNLILKQEGKLILKDLDAYLVPIIPTGLKTASLINTLYLSKLDLLITYNIWIITQIKSLLLYFNHD